VNRIVRRREETKYHSNLRAYQTLGSVFGVNEYAWCEDLTDVTQSTVAASDTTRIGDEVEISRLKVKLAIQANDSAVAGVLGGINRVIIFQYKADTPFSVTNRPTLAEIGRILAPGPTTLAGNEFNSLSHFNHDNRGLFNILYDKSFRQMDATHYGDSTIITRSFDVNLKRARKKINYVAGESNEGQYHIYILAVGWYNTEDARLTYNARMYFKDS